MSLVSRLALSCEPFSLTLVSLGIVSSVAAYYLTKLLIDEISPRKTDNAAVSKLLVKLNV